MKYITILFLVLSMGVFSNAQDNAISKYFSEYNDNPAYTRISVTSKMFSLFTDLDVESEDEKAILEAISKLKGIKGLVNDNAENGIKMYQDAFAKMNADQSYEELMSVQDENENVSFFVRDQNDIISELLMVRGGEHEFMVMTLFGEIDLNAITKLSDVMNIRGMKGLRALDGRKH